MHVKADEIPENTTYGEMAVAQLSFPKGLDVDFLLMGISAAEGALSCRRPRVRRRSRRRHTADEQEHYRDVI